MKALKAVLSVCLWASAYASESLLPRATSNLRIAAMGDSITYGMWSTDLNSYRQNLAMMLQHKGYQVEYIGAVKSGSMINNNSEGYSGATISEIHQKAFGVFADKQQQPNVVLLHAGTNDANNAVKAKRNNATPYTIDGVASKMINDLKDLLDDLVKTAPNTLVVLAQIILDADKDVQDIVKAYNGYIPYLIEKYPKRVIGVSMANVDITGPDHDSVWVDDPTHPGNLGFQKMAGNFFLGIVAADAQQMISAVSSIRPGPQIPVGPSTTNPSTAYAQQCDYYPSWPAEPATIFTGPDVSQGATPSWTAWRDLPGLGGKSLGSSYFYLADINNDGLAEYLLVDPYIGRTDAWRTKDGGATWTSMGNIALGNFEFQGATIKFADMNADGFADYIVHNKSGVYLNYNYYGNGFIQNHLVASGYGGSVESTYFADIDGDGRADLVWVDGGNVRAWMNRGIGTDISWDKSGGILATGATGGASEQFIDVDGDGRADWVHINADATMTVALNPDLVGYGAPPSFRPAISFAPKAGASPANVTLGDINGDKRADIIRADWITGNVQALFNPGMASYGQLRFADGDGDGYRDAWLIDNYGNVKVWKNNGGKFSGAGLQVFTGTGVSVQNTHLADLNADGRADLITAVQSSGTCTIVVYPGDGTLGFGQPTTVWSGVPPQGCKDCSQLQFYDNDGDGRDDILCVTPDAAAWLTYNYNDNPTSLSGINWKYFGWVLINQKVSRNQARFVDLNGDGKGDVMTVNSNGGIHAFISDTASAVFGGVDAFGDNYKISPHNLVLADINRDSRSDYLIVDTNTGSVKALYNQCLDQRYPGSAKQDYPRKPYDPRPGSPGTTLSRGPASPLFSSSNSGPTTTQPPVYCAPYQNPRQGVTQGYCTCTDGNKFSFSRTDAADCPQTSPGPASLRITETTPTPTPDGQCTSSNWDGKVVMYETSHAIPDIPVATTCDGRSRTVFAGASLTVVAEASSAAQVNRFAGAALYTSVSNALTAACPLPTSGSTITSCSQPSAFTSIAYPLTVKGYVGLGYNGQLAMNIPYVKYTNAEDRLNMIESIAGTVDASSGRPENKRLIKATDLDTQSNMFGKKIDFNVTHIPARVESLMFRQDFGSKGDLLWQNMEVEFFFSHSTANDIKDYFCLTSGLTNDVAGILAERGTTRGPGIASAGLGAILTLYCGITAFAPKDPVSSGPDNPSSTNNGPVFGDPVTAVSTDLFTPTLKGYPYTYTATNNAVLAFASPQTSNSAGLYTASTSVLTIAAGTAVRVQVNPTASVNVGDLHGDRLSSSLGSVIRSACPSPTGRTVMAYATPKPITGVAYIDGNDVFTGELEVYIPEAKYSRATSWQALTDGIIGSFVNSSNLPEARREKKLQQWPQPLVDYHILGGMQILLTSQFSNTNGHIDVEQMQVRLHLRTKEPPSVSTCNEGGLAAGIISIFAVIPGLQFLAAASFLLNVVCVAETYG